jgi:hypothetical protein
MKGITPLILIVLLFSACKKQHECVCITTISGTRVASRTEIIDDTKRKAKQECNKSDTTYTILGITRLIDCELK